jgi:hypothetical protein
MKNKTTKSALIVFNDNKVTANKKADIAMKSFKKSLPKAQYGIGSTTPSGQIVKTPEDVAKIKAMQKRLLQKPVDVYTKPIVSKPVPTQKTGGATKATKFAALAPPYNKATAADRIAGAKKNKKK